MAVTHLSMDALEAALPLILDSPKESGTLELIVRRPTAETREVIDTGILSLADGLVGDSWRARSGGAGPETQITLMNTRAIALIAQEPERWALAGDQLYVDLDLSDDNVPPGTLLGVGTSVLEVSVQPHTGCKKFIARFGLDAMKFVNSPRGRALHLRGIYAKVVQAGAVARGDTITKIR